MLVERLLSSCRANTKREIILHKTIGDIPVRELVGRTIHIASARQSHMCGVRRGCLVLCSDEPDELLRVVRMTLLMKNTKLRCRQGISLTGGRRS